MDHKRRCCRFGEHVSGNNYTSDDLPSYIKNGDYEQQEGYHELLSLRLTEWFNSNGFFLPTLTNAQVTALLALQTAPYAVRQWYNSDIQELQWLRPDGTVRTITST